MDAFSWDVGGLRVLGRPPSHVGADCCLEHLVLLHAALSFRGEGWIPSVAVSSQCFNRVNMEAVWPLHDKAPELVQSRLCHILLDKTRHKANTDSRVRETESTSEWEACQCHIAKNRAY